MVVKRTLAKIEELKERPHHERRAIAQYGAIGVMAFLVIFWGFFATRAIGRTAVNLERAQYASSTPTTPDTVPAAAVAAAASAVEPPTVAPPKGLTASSTNGYVDLVPASKIQ